MRKENWAAEKTEEKEDFLYWESFFFCFLDETETLSSVIQSGKVKYRNPIDISQQ